MKSRERMGWTAPVVSHWGISGGRFPELAGPTAGEAHFIQTYSFFDPQRAVGQQVLKALEQWHQMRDAPRGCDAEGLIKTYAKPFTPGNHDALGPEDYIMVHYVGDKVVPVN